MISNVHIFHILPLKLTKQSRFYRMWCGMLGYLDWYPLFVQEQKGETQVNKPWHQAGEVKMSCEHVTCPTEWSKSSTRKRADSHHYSRHTHVSLLILSILASFPVLWQNIPAKTREKELILSHCLIERSPSWWRSHDNIRGQYGGRSSKLAGHIISTLRKQTKRTCLGPAIKPQSLP